MEWKTTTIVKKPVLFYNDGKNRFSLSILDVIATRWHENSLFITMKGVDRDVIYTGELAEIVYRKYKEALQEMKKNDTGHS